MISKLHFITQDINGLTHARSAEAACIAGVKWVQLRVKNQSDDAWLDIAKETLLVCQKYNVKLIINDNVAIALEIGAHGVHLGKGDMPPEEARKLLGNDAIIGGTANTINDIMHLERAGVDYIGLGPFRFTASKDNLSPTLGLEGYNALIQQCREASITTPIIAIGGIIAADVEKIMETGVYGIAVASAINMAQDKASIVRFMNEKINKQNILAAGV